MGTHFFLGLLFLNVCMVYGKDYFTAAVFEHRPREKPEDDVIKAKSANLLFYIKAAETAAKKGADIIVFNEYGIYGYQKIREKIKKFNEPIPNPQKVKFNPCGDKREEIFALSSLSCMAKDNNIYVVADLGDIQPCEGTCDKDNIEDCKSRCFDDGVSLYNTIVVFDREGYLIAKYHKSHLYIENLDVPDDFEYVTFNTEFGRFGIIICFDSMFEETGILTSDYGIDTLLFPTFWFDDIVPLRGVEYQQGMAFAQKVNVLAANTQTPGNGSLGSGIFSKDLGALVYTYEPDGESKLLLAKVPLKKLDNFNPNPTILVIKEDDINEKQETGDLFPEDGYIKVAGPTKDHYLDYRYFKNQMENYTLFKLEKTEGDDIEVCNNEFCCTLSYEADSMVEDYYFAVHNGLNNVRDFYYWWQQACFLVRCNAFENKPCVTQPSRAKTVFSFVEISAEFSTDKIYPTVSKSNLRLAPKYEWKVKNKGSKTTLKFKTDKNEPLLKAGLFGRYYEKDPPYTLFYDY